MPEVFADQRAGGEHIDSAPVGEGEVPVLVEAEDGIRRGVERLLEALGCGVAGLLGQLGRGDVFIEDGHPVFEGVTRISIQMPSVVRRTRTGGDARSRMAASRFSSRRVPRISGRRSQ